MTKPVLPDEERKRLETLHRLKVIDTLPEESFDRITGLAQEAFDVPIALVNLVGEDRQWFKSSVGFSGSEMSIKASFCGRAILNSQPFIVSDAKKDPRFCQSPLVIGEPNIRFYAGIPLTHNNNLKIGTLCIIDKKPRSFSSKEIDHLVHLAKMLEQELSSRFNTTVDSMTQLSNRSGFDCLAEKALRYCEAGRYPFSLAYIEFSELSNINEKYGRQAGDDALSAFAILIRQTFRSSDILGRISDKTFVIFMFGTTERVSSVAVDRFKKAVLKYNQASSKRYNLGFQFGVSSGNGSSGFTVNQLLEGAYNNMHTKLTGMH